MTKQQTIVLSRETEDRLSYALRDLEGSEIRDISIGTYDKRPHFVLVTDAVILKSDLDNLAKSGFELLGFMSSKQFGLFMEFRLN